MVIYGVAAPSATRQPFSFSSYPALYHGFLALLSQSISLHPLENEHNLPKFFFFFSFKLFLSCVLLSFQEGFVLFRSILPQCNVNLSWVFIYCEATGRILQ